MSTNYPTALDDDDSMYDVTDNVDYVLANHHNALKEAVIAIETALGITGAFNFTTDAEFSAHTGGDNPHGVDWADVSSGHDAAAHNSISVTALSDMTGAGSGVVISTAERNALHPVVTTLTHTALTGKNDEADIKHLTDAQQSALHAAVVAGDLNHNDLANIDAGDIKHITAAQLGALHTAVVAGDLNHNDLANINAGDAYEHISATQLAALHTKYALTEDLIANEITVIKAIDDASINNTKWDYIAAMTAQPLENLSEDASPQLGGDLQFDGNYIDMSEAIADHTGVGIFATFLAGPSGVTLGDAVAVSSAGVLLRSNSGGTVSMPAIGIAMETKTSANCKVLLYGIFRDDTWGWTSGGRIYITTTGTAGNTMSHTPPSADGDQVQAFGSALGSDYILVNPSLVLVEVVVP